MSDTECDYDLFRDLAEQTVPDDEHPLEMARRTNDMALRCYFWEHGNVDAWDTMSSAAKSSYKRPPMVDEIRLPSGTYYIYGAHGTLVPVTAAEALDNWAISFCAA